MKAIGESATARENFSLCAGDDPAKAPDAGGLTAIGRDDEGLVGEVGNSRDVLVVECVRL